MAANKNLRALLEEQPPAPPPKPVKEKERYMLWRDLNAYQYENACIAYNNGFRRDVERSETMLALVLRKGNLLRVYYCDGTIHYKQITNPDND